MLTLYDRRNLANMVKSGILRWRDYSGWLGWASVITKVLISGRGRQESERRRCDDGRDVRVTQLLTGRGPQAKECEQPLEGGKGKKRNSSLETLVPCWHLDFILFFFNSLLNLLQYCFCFMLWFYGQRIWNLSSLTRDQTHTPLHWKAKP